MSLNTCRDVVNDQIMLILTYHLCLFQVNSICCQLYPYSININSGYKHTTQKWPEGYSNSANLLKIDYCLIDTYLKEMKTNRNLSLFDKHVSKFDGHSPFAFS